MPSKAPSSVLSLSVPPSLLPLQDTLERYPQARKPLLEAEIARRECQVVLLKSHRLLLRLQLWSALQTAVIAGFIIFSFGVALSGLVQVGKFVQQFGTWNASLPTNVLTRGFQQQVGSILPTSTVLQVADYIPFWDLKDATRLSVLVAVIVLALRIAQGVSQWRANQRLKKGGQMIQQEIDVLRKWFLKG